MKLKGTINDMLLFVVVWLVLTTAPVPILDPPGPTLQNDAGNGFILVYHDQEDKDPAVARALADMDLRTWLDTTVGPDNWRFWDDSVNPPRPLHQELLAKASNHDGGSEGAIIVVARGRNAQVAALNVTNTKQQIETMYNALAAP